MKNTYFALAAILLIAGAMLTGCDNSRVDSKEKVEQANQDMVDSQAQFEQEWQQFKNDIQVKINANQKYIDDFNTAMKSTSKKFKAKYQNEILTLEQKNIEFQKMINDYRYAGNDNWEMFKLQLNSDIDSVGNVLKGLFEKNE